MPAELDHTRYDGLQILRFVAAFLVLVSHATYYAAERLDPATPFWGDGEIGVHIFFVISGFVMVVASKDRTGRWLQWRTFAWRRIARIAPLYWLITSLHLAILIAAPALVLHSDLDPAQIVRSYLLIPDFNADGLIQPLVGVGWTLYYESFFYAVFTLALLIGVRPFWFVAFVLIGCAASSVFSNRISSPLAIYLDPIVLEFLGGMLIAIWAPRICSWRPALSLAVLGAGVLMVALGPSLGMSGLAARAIPALAIVLGTVGLDRHLPKRALRPLIYLGATSYALYLFHTLTGPAAPALLKLLGVTSAGLAVAISVVGSVAAAIIVYELFERPLLSATAARRHDPGDGQPSLSAR